MSLNCIYLCMAYLLSTVNYILVYIILVINRIVYLFLDKLYIVCYVYIVYCIFVYIIYIAYCIFVYIKNIVCKLQKFINKPLQLFAAPWAAARKSLFPHKIYSRPCILLEANISLCMSMFNHSFLYQIYSGPCLLF